MKSKPFHYLGTELRVEDNTRELVMSLSLCSILALGFPFLCLTLRNSPLLLVNDEFTVDYVSDSINVPLRG